MLAEMTGANKEIYNEKIHKSAQSVHNSKAIWTCQARWKIFETVEFPPTKKNETKTSRLLKNTQQVSFPMYRSFGITHVKCYVRLYLVFVIFLYLQNNIFKKLLIN